MARHLNQIWVSITFSSVRAVFGWPLATWLLFRSWPMPISPFRSTDCFHWAKLPSPTIYRKLCNNWYLFCIQNQVSAMSRSELHLRTIILPITKVKGHLRTIILPITKVKGLTAIMTWNIEEFMAYYVPDWE